MMDNMKKMELGLSQLSRLSFLAPKNFFVHFISAALFIHPPLLFCMIVRFFHFRVNYIHFFLIIIIFTGSKNIQKC